MLGKRYQEQVRRVGIYNEKFYCLPELPVLFTKGTGFLDADYAGCKDTFKSTSRGAHFLGEKLVSWSLKKQDCTALSTAKAKYASLSA
ncbi:hypothetical protein Tco_0035962 [Tanacetum coccineum]